MLNAALSRRRSRHVHTELKRQHFMYFDRAYSDGSVHTVPPGVKKVKVAHTRYTERRVPEPIPVLSSQPAGDVSHKPGGRLPLLSARPAVTLANLKRAATNFAAW